MVEVIRLLFNVVRLKNMIDRVMLFSVCITHSSFSQIVKVLRALNNLWFVTWFVNSHAQGNKQFNQHKYLSVMVLTT